MKKNLNQKLIGLIEYYNLLNSDIFLSNNPLKRVLNNSITTFSGTKIQKLEKLKNSIQLIKNCNLKKMPIILYLVTGTLILK